jgi:hypothetical protein
MNLPPITDVPPSQVGQIVQSFIDHDNVRQLSVDQQSDGDFTITPVQ